MLGNISQLTFEQFSLLLSKEWVRRVTSVHIHHTWRPTANQWRGQSTVVAIRNYHVVTNGWSDIAQHLTIGPDGTLWSGRNLDRPPASATGFNGNTSEGPFMIEMIGDFDIGKDVFGGMQEQTVYLTIAMICRRFGLATSNVRFHREFTSAKTCPGSSLDLQGFRISVDIVLKKLPKDSGGVASKFAETARASYMHQVTMGADARSIDSAETNAEPIYDVNLERAWLMSANTRGLDFTEEEQYLFSKHVVNTEMGRLSSSGGVTSSSESLDELIGHIDEWSKGVEQPRIVLFAHGGLVSEETALRNLVLPYAKWWLSNDVYPVFFVWETGFFEVFRQTQQETQQIGERGLVNWILETVLGPTIGRPAWDRMKASAFLAALPEIHSGTQGGAYLFVEKLTNWLVKANKRSKKTQIHAVGHSAGSIFHSELLPVLTDMIRKKKIVPPNQSAISSLAMLAPACRVDLFKEKLLPLIKAGDVGAFAQFTMDIETERKDSLIGIYRGSLLYAVRNACEMDCPPILGLEESIRPDTDLSALFGLDGKKSLGELVLSPSADINGHAASRSLAHGDFDNDPPTMNSVMRRILGLTDDVFLPSPMINHEFPKGTTRAISEFVKLGEENSPQGSSKIVHALCIGIDEYAGAALSGCVADARLWASTLTSRGAVVHRVLTNAEATKRSIVAAWKEVCFKAKPGDTVVIQYAGHGTQVPDDSGDESDGKDEAWVAYDYEKGEVLTDDEIGGLIDRFTPAGVQLVLFTDCCHSGSGSRAKDATSLAGPGSRFLPLMQNERFVRTFRIAKTRWAPELKGRATDILGSEIHFAGCQDPQSSYESDGHGAFTLAATDALRSLPLGASYMELANRIATRFEGNPNQNPNFRSWPQSRPLSIFGVDLDRQPIAPIAHVGESSVLSRLDAIEMHLAAIKSSLAELR